MKKERLKFTESLIRTILRDICSGLKFLHQHNIVHLDIKPGNTSYKLKNVNCGFREHIVFIYQEIQVS